MVNVEEKYMRLRLGKLSGRHTVHRMSALERAGAVARAITIFENTQKQAVSIFFESVIASWSM